MRPLWIKITAVCLVICLLLSGCSAIGDYFTKLSGYLFGGGYSFEEMQYTRPDLDAFRKELEDCCDAARTETNFEKLIAKILQFNAAYDSYATARALAMIHYCKDMTNESWEEEYNFCEQASTEVTAGVDRLYRLLAKSTLRPKLESELYFGAGFFEHYEGESLFDETFTAFLEQETQLKNDYYAIYADAGGLEYGSTEFYDQYGTQMAQILVELVLLRQQIGSYAGYDSYADFAYDFYYFRDFTAEQTAVYLADIQSELVPLYRQLGSEELGITLYPCDEQATFDYVAATAKAMGGMVKDAFDDMARYELYDISASEYKYNASFEVFISGYMTPYVFVNPTETERDKLTFVHEFGHFCNDHASRGSMAGIDVAEIYSQGMEYLSLVYGPTDENLRKLKMLDSLSVYVEQAALASFEQALYGLSAEEVTVDAISQLYTDTCASFGIDSENAYIYITHFYTNPMYVISYVVSNDAALQIYQLEQAEAGAGRTLYMQNLIPWKTDFLAFLENAGLDSPFAEGRLQEVKSTLETILLP